MEYKMKSSDVATYVLEDANDPEQLALFEAAYALYDQLFVEEEKDDKEALLAGIASGAGRRAPFVVAVDQGTGQVVGGAVVTVFDDRPACTFGYLFTDKRLRGKGIGRLLQETALLYVKGFNGLKANPADLSRITILADIENPGKMSARDILITTAKADIDPWARARFWERLGFLPVVSTQTGEAFPFVAIPDAEDAEPTTALDLWIKQPWGEGQASPIFDAKEVTRDVAFWLFGTAELSRNAFRPPFNNPAVDEMVKWHERHRSLSTSIEHLKEIYSTEVKFRNIIASIIEEGVGDIRKGNDIRMGVVSISEIARHVTEHPSLNKEDATQFALSAHKLDDLDNLWERACQ